jgi:hypothetical protein
MSADTVTRFQFLEGTTAQRIAMVPRRSEAIYDIEQKLLYIGDGETYGGNVNTPNPLTYNIVVHTTNTVLTVEDYAIANSASAIQFTLPDATTYLKPVHVKNAGAGVLTIIGVGGQTIDSELDIQLRTTNAVTLVPKAGAWYVF